MTRLTALAFSPWSEKARWALDHHRVPYEYEEHIIMIGELRLRARMRKPKGLITVPVLEERGRFFTDSFDIVKHAERIGGGTQLLPNDKLAEIEAWNRRSEGALASGRAIMILRAADDPEGARKLLPRRVPRFLQPALARLSRKVLERMVVKYRMREDADSHGRVIEEALAALDTALAGKNGHLLGGELSYADIAMAVVLQFVSPVDKRYMKTGPGGRSAWTNDELARRFKHLVEWRDELYAKHRRPRAAS